VWWISSINGLQNGLITYIDNLLVRSEVNSLPVAPDTSVKKTGLEQGSTSCDGLVLQSTLGIQDQNLCLCSVHPSRVAKIQDPDSNYSTSECDSVSTTETDIQNQVIENCEAFLEQSKQERNAIGRHTRQASRVEKRRANKKKPV
jgi:hypothetical protein